MCPVCRMLQHRKTVFFMMSDFQRQRRVWDLTKNNNSRTELQLI